MMRVRRGMVATASLLLLLLAFATWSIVLVGRVSVLRREVEEGAVLLSRLGTLERTLSSIAQRPTFAPGDRGDRRREIEDLRLTVSELRTSSAKWRGEAGLDGMSAVLALADDRLSRGPVSAADLAPLVEEGNKRARESVSKVRERLGSLSGDLGTLWNQLYVLVGCSLSVAFVAGAVLLLLQRSHRLLEASSRRHRLLADSIEDVVSLHDAAGRIVHVGPTEGSRRSSLTERAGGARRIAEEIHVRLVQQNLESAETPWERPDGSEGWIETRVRAVDSSPEAPWSWLATSRDITDRRRAVAQMERLAYHDSLTGLPNRMLLLDRLGVALASAHRDGNEVAVVCLDLDRFQTINQSAGPSVGDRLLQAVAARLSSTLGEGDTLARTGGDEFTAVVPRPPEPRILSRRLLAAFESPFEAQGREIGLGASIGTSLYPHDGLEAEELLKRAYVAMTRAKDGGRGTTVRWENGMLEQAEERLLLRNGLRRALERREFLLFYQPQASLVSGRITGMEALIRWRHPVRGILTPAEFLFLLEETGLIEPVGEWVLGEACAQLRRWQDAGFGDLSVAVNLSPRQFRQQDLAERVRRALEENGVPANRLELEITEYAAMTHPELAIATLRRLEDLGVRIALDDFGTGYSSLGYLKRFPIHSLKIDQSFIREVTTDPDDAAISRAIIRLAHSLGRKVVAEGVETEMQATFLREQGCDEIQGYLISRPLPPEELVERLRRHPTWPLRPEEPGEGELERA